MVRCERVQGNGRVLLSVNGDRFELNQQLFEYDAALVAN